MKNNLKLFVLCMVISILGNAIFGSFFDLIFIVFVGIVIVWLLGFCLYKKIKKNI